MAAVTSTSASAEPVSSSAPGKLAQFLLGLFVLQPLGTVGKGFWAGAELLRRKESSLLASLSIPIINLLGDVTRLLSLVKRHPQSRFHCDVWEHHCAPSCFHSLLS